MRLRQLCPVSLFQFGDGRGFHRKCWSTAPLPGFGVQGEWSRCIKQWYIVSNQDSRGCSIRKSLKPDSCPSFAWYCYVLLVQECLSFNCVPWTARSNHRHARLSWSSKRLWGMLLKLSCFHRNPTEYPILKKGAPTALTGLENFAVKEYKFDSSLFGILLCGQWPQRNVWFK